MWRHPSERISIGWLSAMFGCLSGNSFISVPDCGAKADQLSSHPVSGDGALIKLTGNAVKDFLPRFARRCFLRRAISETTWCLALHPTPCRWKHDWSATAQRQRDTTTPPTPCRWFGDFACCVAATPTQGRCRPEYGARTRCLAHQSAVHRRGVGGAVKRSPVSCLRRPPALRKHRVFMNQYPSRRWLTGHSNA